jgi:hypothetical protein
MEIPGCKAAGPASDDCEGVFATLASAAEFDLRAGDTHAALVIMEIGSTSHNGPRFFD